MVVKDLPSIIKWGIIGLMLWSIWMCIASDPEGSEESRESFSPIDRPTPISHQPTCGSGDESCISATGDRLLPVLDPCFNMREICKQSILLEDHLFQTEKRCTDCIKKHFLTLEGLAEEAITLDKEDEYNLHELRLPERLRELQKKFLQKEEPQSIAQSLRQIRKPLMARFFDHF